MKSRLLTGINDVILSTDFSYQVASGYRVRFGGVGTYHHLRPNDEFYERIDDEEVLTRSYSSQTHAFENALYMEHELTNEYFGLNAGLRLSNFIVDQKVYNYLEPRVSINIPVQSDLSLKGSYARSNQFMHLLSYSGAGLPADYWMPSTAGVSPSRANQYTLGVAKTFEGGLYQLSVEGYRKELQGMIAFKPGASLVGNLSSWEDVIFSHGKGLNYGVEVFLQKSRGRSTGWAGVTLSKAERQFQELNSGKSFPFKYDRLLDISLVWNREVTKNLLLSATWTYGTGYPITLASERYIAEGVEVFVFNGVNNHRMRDYHRLDFSVSLPRETTWGESMWSFSIFNLYNRRNPYYYFYDKRVVRVEENAEGIPTQAIYGPWKLYQRSLFGFFPSLSYSFKF